MSENNFIDYSAVLHELKEKIKQARIRAFLSVNKELLQTYWDIGSVIAQQQKAEGWGAGIIKSLSRDLQMEFPDMKGISPRNLRYMRDFAMAYPYFPILQEAPAKLSNSRNSFENQQFVIWQEPLAKLTWYHHQTLIDKVRDPVIRQFYILKTMENGWSRNVMVHQIESGLRNRQGALVTNFNKTVALEQSDLLQQIFKDPYNFDFLQMTDRVRERDLESALIQHIKKFLLELGDGFAFMGQQYRLPSIEELEQKMDEELDEGINPIDARLKAVKEKLKNITNDEIQTPVTFPILSVLYQKDVRPLYQLIIEKFTDFNELFHDYRCEWYHGNIHIDSLQQLDGVWNNESELQKNNEILFDYRLFGFRKAGTENYSAQVRLRFEINTYWYGFSIVNNNDRQPFLKKLYHQGLDDENKQHVIEILTNNMLDQIEWIVRRIEEKLHTVI